jgi:predicted metal-binding membrane protein
MAGATSQHAFLGASALLFAVSVTVTIAWSTSMSEAGGMVMPGGWTMSMAWMRMPGQTWAGTTSTFLGMWAVMMVAMMLPSVMPMLSRYRKSVRGPGDARLGLLTALVGVGYFFVWTAFGVIAFPLGVALATMEMRQPALSRAVPAAAAVIMLIAGALQFTSWKARQLACCRDSSRLGDVVGADATTAWRYGVRLGLDCGPCCANLMVILLVIGVMDLPAMAIVTSAITAERLAPAGERVARAIGALTVGAGLILGARAFGLG